MALDSKKFLTRGKISANDLFAKNSSARPSRKRSLFRGDIESQTGDKVTTESEKTIKKSDKKST